MCLLNQAATCPKGFDDVQERMLFSRRECVGNGHH
jgi:hypothetical protein